MGRRTLALTLAFLVTDASAANALAVRGSGAVSCGSWTSEHQQNSIVASGMDLWLMGYVTAYNRWTFKGPDVADGTDNAGLVAALSQYCATHPLDTVETAAENLVMQLIARDTANYFNSGGH